MKSKSQMKFSSLLIYAFSMIKSRPLSFLLNVFIVFIAATYMDSLGYFAHSVYLGVKPTQENKRIVVKCYEEKLSNPNYLFNKKNLEKFRSQQFVDAIFEIVERGINLKIGENDSLYCNVSSTDIKDQDINPGNIIFGRHISANDAKEIILSRPLYEDLAKHSFNHQSVESYVRIHMERNRDGKPESFDQDYAIAGIIESLDRQAYIPIDTIKSLDKWGLSVIEENPDESDKKNKTKDGAKSLIAFFREKPSLKTLEELESYYKINVMPFIEQEYLSCETKPAMRLFYEEGFNSNKVAETFELVKDRCEIFFVEKRSINLSGLNFKLIGIDKKDSRFQNIKCSNGNLVNSILKKTGSVIIAPNVSGLAMSNGNIIIKEGFIPKTINVGGTLNPSDGPINFDILCSLETIAYIDKKSVEPIPVCAVKTKSKALSADLRDGKLGNVVAFGPNLADNPQNKSLQLYGDLTKPEDIYSKPDNDTDLDEVKPTSGLEPINGYNQSREDSFQDLVMIEGYQSSVWSQVRKYKDVFTDLEQFLLLPNFTITDSDLNPFKLLFFEAGALSRLFPSCYQRLKSTEALVSGLSFYADRSIKIGSRSFGLRSCDYEFFPLNVLFVREGIINSYDLEVEESNSGGSLIGSEIRAINSLDIYLSSVKNYNKQKQGYINQGYEVVDLCEIKSHLAIGYRLTPKNGEFFSNELLMLLKDEAQFDLIFPDFSVNGFANYNAQFEVEFATSSPSDPRKNLDDLIAGAWLKDENSFEVILPKDLIDRAGISYNDFEQGLKPIIFRNADSSREISIDCMVTGIVDGNKGFISASLAEKINAWSEGLVEYNDRIGFAASSEIYDSSGYARCKVFIRSADDLEEAIIYFQNQGYKPDDPLAEKKRAQFLGNVLLFMVILLAGGSIIGGIANVFITTLMNTQSKQYEIGLLRAGGVSRFTIIKIYLVFGLVIGLISGLVALPVSGIVSEFVTTFWDKAFGLPIKEVLTLPIWHFSFLWLHGLTLVMAIFSSIGAVLVAALLAVKISIADAFLMRE